MMITENSPNKAAYDNDLASPNFCTTKKYSAGITVLAKPANGHHLNGTGSLTSANSVLQWSQRTVYAVPRRRYLEQVLIEIER
jgi:hypothetical protein